MPDLRRRPLLPVLLAVPLLGAALGGSLLWRGDSPPPADTLYSANLRSSDVSIVNLASGRERLRVPVADNPHELLQAGGEVWVSDYHSAAVTRFTPAGAAPQRLAVAGEPHGLALVGGAVAVTQGRAGQVALLDAAGGDLLTEAPTGGEPHMAAAFADRLYAVDAAGDALLEIDPVAASVTRRVAVGHVPESLTISPDGRTIAVANARSHDLSLIDRDSFSESRRQPLPGAPVRAQYSRDGRTLAISLNDAGLVMLLSGTDGRTRALVPVGRLPDGLAFSTDGQTLYVALSGERRIAVLRLRDRKVTGYISVGDGPSGLLLVPAGAGR